MGKNSTKTYISYKAGPSHNNMPKVLCNDIHIHSKDALQWYSYAQDCMLMIFIHPRIANWYSYAHDWLLIIFICQGLLFNDIHTFGPFALLDISLHPPLPNLTTTYVGSNKKEFNVYSFYVSKEA